VMPMSLELTLEKRGAAAVTLGNHVNWPPL
jgi:hypothetical protein